MNPANDIGNFFRTITAAGAIFVVTLSSCSEENPPVFSQFVPVEEAVMHSDQWFEFDTRKDTLFRPENGKTYDVVLQVRHTPDFSHQILWLATEVADSAGRITTDTIGIRLNKPDGHPDGHGTRGLYLTQKTLHENVYLTPGYILSVSQAMKENEVHGITDIGLVINPHNTPNDKHKRQ